MHYSYKKMNVSDSIHNYHINFDKSSGIILFMKKDKIYVRN